MILLVRLAPLFVGLATLISFEYVLRVPAQFFAIGGALVFAVAVAGAFIARPLTRTTGLLLVAPLLLLVGSLGFVLFPDEPLVRQLVAIGTSLLLWNYYEQLFAYVFRTERYQAFALENISAYVNIASVFLITSALFGLRFFLGLPAWLLILAAAVTLFIAAMHTFAIGKLEGRRAFISSMLVTLLGTEVVVALLLLPADQYVNGLLVATFFYVTMNLTHYEVRATLDRARLRRYVLIGLVVVFLTLLTASWR